MKFSYLLVAILLISAFSNCKKDKGNYDYKDLPSLYIDTSGLQRVYTKKQNTEELEISPTVVYSGKNTLDFYWIKAQRVANGVPIVADTLSRERSLRHLIDWQITSGPSPFSVFFQVVERETGNMDFVEFVVNVTGAYAAGIFVAHERNGTADFDLIENPISDASRVYHNLYSVSGGARLPGTVRDIQSVSNGTVLFMTDQHYRLLTSTSFAHIASDRDFFAALDPGAILPEACGYYGPNQGFVINGGLVYTNYAGPSVPPSAITQKIQMQDESAYKMAPVYLRPYSKGGVFFDELNGRFAQCGPNYGNVFEPIIEALPGSRFSLHDIDKILLGMGRGYTLAARNTTFMAIFMDKTGGPQRYLYVLDMDNPSTPDLALVDISGVADIQQAHQYLTLTSTPVFYYATSGKVYLLQVNAPGNSVVEAGVQFSAPPGEEITCLLSDNNTRCYVSTYLPATDESKVYLMTVSSGNGLFQSAPAKTWSGFTGKITRLGRKRL